MSLNKNEQEIRIAEFKRDKGSKLRGCSIGIGIFIFLLFTSGIDIFETWRQHELTEKLHELYYLQRGLFLLDKDCAAAFAAVYQGLGEEKVIEREEGGILVNLHSEWALENRSFVLNEIGKSGMPFTLEKFEKNMKKVFYGNLCELDLENKKSKFFL